MARRRADDDVERRRVRPLRPAPEPGRVYWHKDRLIHELRHICPTELSFFPDASTFNFWNAVTNDGAHEFRPLEIGNVWPRSPSEADYDLAPQSLFVIDRGAYNSDPPELFPFSSEGAVQHYIVEANGFDPSGVFEAFRQVNVDRSEHVNPRLNDPLIISLIQFIFILRGMRRYYFYPTPHNAPPRIQLGFLVEALHLVATHRARLAAQLPTPQMNGSGLSGPQRQQASIAPTSAIREEGTFHAADINGHANNHITTNGVMANGDRRAVRATTNGVLPNRSMENGTTTEGFMPNGTGDRTAAQAGSNQALSNGTMTNGTLANGVTTRGTMPNGTGAGTAVTVNLNGALPNGIMENGSTTEGSIPEETGASPETLLHGADDDHEMDSQDSRASRL
ncbi:hypothetical protein OPT61_g3585 [Boeremia exigua]|uniref:Uncharacterized protein n=1 Tax=Boeremia exigua TaxID=749465 RepID=A0ACC2IHE1_9PLEO|nr:hypothetical protein OPT61_g3585 [Boeremia exigua]